MLSSVVREECPECSGEVVDVGEEFVCRSCGVVAEKEVIESRRGRPPEAIDYTSQALGGYLGPIEYGFKEIHSPGFSGAGSTFRYLKLVSDFAGRDDGLIYNCAKMIERVCEKLGLPRVVVAEAVVLSKKLLDLKRAEKSVTSAALSAFAIISACRIVGVASVSVKEVVEAHRLLGHRVKASALIYLSMNSPLKVEPRRAEDYVARVMARLPSIISGSSRVGPSEAALSAYLTGLRSATIEVLGLADRETRAGHNPCALAATAAYAAEVVLCRRQGRRKMLSQRDAALAVGVAEYTVREQYGQVFRPMVASLGVPPRSQNLPVPRSR
jgi:transcription initiation factor TFIIIB Brf1 subunit/transcription initiation factor TFIIB